MGDDLPLRWWLAWHAGPDPGALSSVPARTSVASRRRAR
jgi:hypothetical protein